MCVLAMLALFNPAASVLVEMDSGASPNAAIVRQVPVTTLLDEMARTLALYFVEPTTNCCRTCANGPMGTGTFNSWQMQTGFTGYALFACELYLLVQQRLAGAHPLPTYYTFPGV